MEIRLDGKVVLVTGGTQGLGEAIARACAGSAVAGVAVTGALGAFTTFSTFATQLAEHLRSGRRWHAATYTVLTVVGAVAAATVGLVLGA